MVAIGPPGRATGRLELKEAARGLPQIADEPRFFRGSLRLDVLNSGGDGSSPIFATGLPIGQISQFPAPFPNLALQAWYPKGFEP